MVLKFLGSYTFTKQNKKTYFRPKYAKDFNFCFLDEICPPPSTPISIKNIPYIALFWSWILQILFSKIKLFTYVSNQNSLLKQKQYFQPRNVIAVFIMFLIKRLKYKAETWNIFQAVCVWGGGIFAQ